MASEVSICNRALSILGHEPLLALSDDTNAGRTMNATYSDVRDAEHDRHRWRHTFKRATLAASVTNPDFDYARQFQLPSDFIRLVEGGDIYKVADLNDYRTGTNEDWSIEGGMLLTHLAAPLRIRYIARIVDTALFPPSFAESLACRIAFEACERITQSDTKKQTCWQQYRASLMEAVRARALEASPRSISDGTWITARVSEN